MKTFELISLHGVPGSYTAAIYNRAHGYFKEVRFLWCSKKEIFYKLRHEYGCSVPRGF